MDTETLILISIPFVWGIIFGCFCAFLAKQKNRDTGAWFILGFLFSLIALIAIAVSPIREKKIEAEVHEKPLPTSKGEKIVLRIVLILGLLALAVAIAINILQK